MAQTKNQYKDLSFSFDSHPITGDLITKTGDISIKQSIKNLVLTQYFERLDSKIGSGIYRSLFKLDSFIAINTLKERLVELISKYEPRVGLLSVSVQTEEGNRVRIVISFTSQETNVSSQVEFFVNRIR